MTLADQVAQQLVRYYPTLKDYQAEKAAKKYCEAMLQAIANSILGFGIANEQISLPLDAIRQEVGKITIGKKQFWINNLIQTSQKDMSLVIVGFEGNVGKYSRVSLNPKYERKIMEEITSLSAEFDESRVKQLEDEANYEVEIDEAKLRRYIQATQLDLDDANAKGKSSRYTSKLVRNLLVARHLLSRAEANNGILKQKIVHHPYGRDYMQGINLQGASSFVRHAALGDCWQYDMQAASYSLMAGLAVVIDTTVRVDALTAYVKNRKKIRADLATHVFSLMPTSTDLARDQAEDRIKQVFNALGFGAKAVNDAKADAIYSKNAIAKILGQEGSELLQSHPTFKAINSELDVIRKLLNQNFEQACELVGAVAIPTELENKRASSQRLSFLFMHAETQARQAFLSAFVMHKATTMARNAVTREDPDLWIQLSAEERECFVNEFIDEAMKALKDELLLEVHDCVYFKHAINAEVLDEMHGRIYETADHLQFVKFEGERAKSRVTSSVELEAKRLKAEHDEHLRIEEYNARNFVPKKAEVIHAVWTRPEAPQNTAPMNSEDYDELTDEQIEAMKELAATPAPKAMSLGKAVSW